MATMISGNVDKTSQFAWTSLLCFFESINNSLKLLIQYLSILRLRPSPKNTNIIIPTQFVCRQLDEFVLALLRASNSFEDIFIPCISFLKYLK